MKFDVILADPPWRFKNWSSTELATRGEKWGRANGRSPYPVMNTEDIAALPVADIAAKNSLLFLWATYPKLPEALQTITGWGFTFKTVAFSWIKTNPSGKGWHFGLGYWTRGNPEICLLGTRGSPASRISCSVPNLLVAPRGRHSAKPPEVRERIVELLGTRFRLELFARDVAPGWIATGLDLDGWDVRDAIPALVELNAPSLVREDAKFSLSLKQTEDCPKVSGAGNR